MNAAADTIIPTSAAPRAAGDCRVGLAVIWFLPGAITPCAFWLFGRCLQAALARAQIGAKDFGGLFNPDFMVGTAAVRDRDAALRELQNFADELGLFNCCEIAFCDQPGSTWTTVFPAQAEPFERFLTRQNLEAAKQKLDSDQRGMNAILLRLLRSQPGE